MHELYKTMKVDTWNDWILKVAYYKYAICFSNSSVYAIQFELKSQLAN